MSWKHTALAVAAALALGAPAPARADNSGMLMRLVGAVLSVAGMPYFGAALMYLGGLKQGSEERRKIRRAEAARRQKAIDNLQARNISALTAEPPMRGGYGRCQAGGDYVAVFTTDKVATNDWGSTVTRPDALRHIVVHFLSRQAHAIHEIFIDGKPLGTLDGSGYPTGGEFYTAKEATRTITVAGGATFTLAADARPATAIVGTPFYTTGSGDNTQNVNTTATIAVDGLSITAGAASEPVQITYAYTALSRPVRVSKFLGTSTQAVDAYLNGLLPAKWTADHRGRGLAGIVITLDLEDQRFQGGQPNITAEGSWALVYDPRKDSTQPGGSGAHRYTDPTTWEWSANPALCTADWLCSELGYACNPASDIDWAYVVAAANHCDATGTFDEGAGPFTAARYTCNGAFTSDESKEKVLEDLTESMAGVAVPAAQWQVMAGAWTTAVATLDDDDLAGSIEVLQADTPTDALINSARGRYIPSGKSQPAESNPPYSNATFVTADQGVKLWDDFQFPWTNSNARTRDLLRIKVEQRRSGLIVQYPAKLTAWGLRVGERVLVNHTPYAWAGKAFRITDRRHTQHSPVLLTLQEDAPEIWDQADAATADPLPNTGLPNRFSVDALASLAATSSEATMIRTSDGTWQPGVDVSWSAITDRNSLPDGRVEVFWRRNAEVFWRTLPSVPADSTATRISGGNLREGDRVFVRARVRNRFNQQGPDRHAFAVVVGKTSAATTPTGLAATAQPGGVLVSVTPVSESWIKETEFRYGASWDAGTVLYVGRAASFVWPWPAAGTYTVRAKHRDTSGNESAEATTSITVTSTNTLIDTGETAPNLATEVVDGSSSDVTCTWVRGAGPDLFTAMRRVVHQESWTNSTGAAVNVAVSVTLTGYRTAGAGTVKLYWAVSTSGAIADGDFTNSDALAFMMPADAGFAQFVRDSSISVADGQTLHVAAVVIIQTSNSTTTTALAKNGNVKLEALKR